MQMQAAAARDTTSASKGGNKSDNTKNQRGNKKDEQPTLCVCHQARSGAREVTSEIAKQPGKPVQPRITRSSQQRNHARATE